MTCETLEHDCTKLVSSFVLPCMYCTTVIHLVKTQKTLSGCEQILLQFRAMQLIQFHIVSHVWECV